MKQEKSIRDLIMKYENDICYLQQMQIYSMSTYEKNYYNEQINKTTNAIIKELDNILNWGPYNSHKPSKESNYIIRKKQEENEPIEDYKFNSGSEFIISQEPNTENEFFIRTERETEDDYIINMETNEIDFDHNVEPIMIKEFTLEELSAFNGTNGNPPYVAVNGIVYDMSNIGPWAGGTHFGLLAGNNLTDQFISCHRGAQSVLNKLNQVGILVNEK